LFKSLLFLGAGAVVHATGTRQMSRLGGLWVRMPWTTGMFAMGAVAIAGLPPLNGFVSEWLIYVGLFEAVNQRGSMLWGAIPAVVLLGMTGALALACFVKVCGVVFLGSPRSVEAQRAHECGVGMRGAMGWVGWGCVGIGLVPVMAWPALRSAVGAWQGEWLELGGPGSLVVLGRVHVMLAVLGVLGSVGLWHWSRRAGWVRGPTWDCGYAAPTARMQYTAGSFASIICGWFAWVLRPVKHVVRPEGAFPREGLVDVHTPEVVLERVIGPWARWVMWISGWVRRLQHGRVQAYLAYVLFGLLLVAWVTLAWSSR
jgi:hydrogenase-4 component B